MLLGKKVLSREGGFIIAKDMFYEEGVLSWKKCFFDKEVLLWKKSSTKKRKFYFAERILFQMRRKFWYGKVLL